jgi:hypothetical protein
MTLLTIAPTILLRYPDVPRVYRINDPTPYVSR